MENPTPKPLTAADAAAPAPAPPQSRHWVLDIETLGTSPDAIVLSIGYFPLIPNENPADCATRCLDPTAGGEIFLDVPEQIAAGRCFDLPTVGWWFEKPDPQVARAAFFDGERMGVADAAVAINWDMQGAERVWCHTDFDLPILAHLFTPTYQADIRFADIRATGGGGWAPWPYWCGRDLRTHHELLRASLPPDAIARIDKQVDALRHALPAHGALNDAAVQAYRKTCLEWELTKAQAQAEKSLRQMIILDETDRLA